MADAERQLQGGSSGPGINLIFACTALALDGAFLTGVLPALLPFRPQSPLWILEGCRSVIQHAPLPLIGICLLLMASRRHPDDALVRSWLLGSRRLCVAVTLGLLLLLPLQILATVLALHGPDQLLQRNVEALQTLRREMTQRVALQPAAGQVEALLYPSWLPRSAPSSVAASGPSIPSQPLLADASGLLSPPPLPSRSRAAVMAELDRAIALRSPQAFEQGRLSLNRRGLNLLTGLLQTALLLPAYAAAATINPRSGSLLQGILESWRSSREDLIKARRERRNQRHNSQHRTLRRQPQDPRHRSRLEEQQDRELVEAARLLRRFSHEAGGSREGSQPLQGERSDPPERPESSGPSPSDS